MTLDVAGVLLAATVALAAPWALDAVPVDPPAAGPRPAPALRPTLPAVSVQVASVQAAGVRAVARVPLALPPSVDLTGRELGPYRLEERIGEGTLGCVYRARHTVLGATRAVKALRADLAGDPRLRSRFLHAAVTAARLRHPNVVAVHDCGSDDEVPYVVMEYVESLTLAEHLRRLPAADLAGDPMLRRCVGDVAAALDHIHACGAVHGGLRPANVLVRTADARAMLSDCVIARSLGAAPAAADDLHAFAAMLDEIATGGPPVARALPSPDDRHRTAGELAAAYLKAVS
jgi:serine/threonine protein kinase